MYVSVLKNILILFATSLLLSSCRFGFLPIESKKDLLEQPAPIRITLSGASTQKVGECKPLTLRLLAADGNLANAPIDLEIALVGSIIGEPQADKDSFYGDANCSQKLPDGKITMDSISNTRTVYFSRLRATQALISASTPGLVFGNLSVEVLPETAVKLALSGDGSPTAGSCGGYSFRVEDANGNLSTLDQNLLVTLRATRTDNGSLEGTFYQDASCSQSLGNATNVTLLAGAGTANFYFKNNNARLMTLIAQGGKLSSALMSVQISSGVGTNLVISGDSQITTDTCGQYNVTLKDANNNDTTTNSNLVINLTETGNGRFYSNAGCSSLISSVVIFPSQSNRTFYYRDTKVETVTLTATSTLGASGTMAVSVGAGIPNRVAISGLSSIGANVCSPYTLERYDSSNNPSNVGQTNIQIDDNSGQGKFFNSSNCDGSGSDALSTSIGAGQSQTVVYYKNEVPQSVALDVNPSGVSAPGDFPVTVNPGAGSSFQISGNQTIEAGQCQNYRTLLVDAAGNPTTPSSNLSLSLLGRGNGTYYSNSSCSNTITSIGMNSNQSEVSYYFRSTQPETVNLRSTAGSISGSREVEITPADASQLRIAGNGSIAAGTCVAYTISREDAFNNSTSPSSIQSVSMSDSSAQGVFYSNSSCTTELTSSTSRILGNQPSMTVYYKNDRARTFTMRASASGLSNGALNVSVSGSVAVGLMLTSASTSLTSLDCVEVNVTRVDALGNPVFASSSQQVNLAEDGNLKLSSNSSCSNSINSVSISSNQSTENFYISSPSSENVTLTAMTAGDALSSTNRAFTIRPGRLLMVSGSRNIQTGNCEAYSVKRQDRNSQDWSDGLALTLSLGGNGSGRFYSNSGCTAQTSQREIASNNHIVTFYYRNNSAESVNFQISANGITNETYGVTVSGSMSANQTGIASTQSGVEALTLDTPEPSLAAAYGAAVTGEGKVLVVGQTQHLGNSDILLARYQSNGSLDPQFGENGMSVFGMSPADEVAYSIQVLENGYILVGGHRTQGEATRVLLVRFDDFGNLDKGYGQEGVVEFNYNAQFPASVHHLKLQENGDVVASGFERQGGSGSFMYVQKAFDRMGKPSAEEYSSLEQALGLELDGSKERVRISLPSELRVNLTSAGVASLLGNGTEVEQPIP